MYIIYNVIILCVYVCMYVCMCVYVCVCVFVCTCARIQTEDEDMYFTVRPMTHKQPMTSSVRRHVQIVQNGMLLHMGVCHQYDVFVQVIGYAVNFQTGHRLIGVCPHVCVIACIVTFK